MGTFGKGIYFDATTPRKMTLAISTAALEGSKKKKVSLPSVLNAGQFRRIKK